MNEEEYFYCRECRYDIKLKDKKEHEWLHNCEDEFNAEEGIQAELIRCSEKLSNKNCKICKEKLQAGKKGIKFVCCNNVIHLRCRRKMKNNSFCPYCCKCVVLFDEIDEEFKSNDFIANSFSKDYAAQFTTTTRLTENGLNHESLNDEIIITENIKEVKEEDNSEIKSQENQKEEEKKKEKDNSEVESISKQSNDNLCREKESNNDIKIKFGNDKKNSDTQYLSNKKNRD